MWREISPLLWDHPLGLNWCIFPLFNFISWQKLTWRCSVCRRKMASRVCIPQDSTDSMLDVPVIEALQRRHSDVKLGSSQQLSTGNGLGLAPPRGPELRRHSDVSPATIKELEKVMCRTVFACPMSIVYTYIYIYLCICVIHCVSVSVSVFVSCRQCVDCWSCMQTKSLTWSVKGQRRLE